MRDFFVPRSLLQKCFLDIASVKVHFGRYKKSFKALAYFLASSNLIAKREKIVGNNHNLFSVNVQKFRATIGRSCTYGAYAPQGIKLVKQKNSGSYR